MEDGSHSSASPHSSDSPAKRPTCSNSPAKQPTCTDSPVKQSACTDSPAADASCRDLVHQAANGVHEQNGQKSRNGDASRTRGRTIPAHEGPWADGLGDSSPWALLGTYCFNAPDHLPAAVAPRVLVGSVLHATAVHMLRSIGVTMVINVAASQCRVPTSEFEAAGIEYHALDAKDEEGYPILEQHYPTVHALLKPILGGQGRALVHCVAGRNRSVTLAVAAVMLHERRPLPLIARRAFQRRPFILTNMSFRRQLTELARIHQLLEVKPEE